MRFKQREKILLYVVGGLVLVYLIEEFFFSDLYKKKKEMNQQIKIQELSLVTNLDIQRRKETILLAYKKYQSYLEMAQVSDRDAIARFLKEIEKMAQGSGVSIVNLNPQNEPEQTEGYKRYTAELRIEGGLAQIFDFLYRIQNAPLLIKLDKVAIAPKNEAASILKVDTTVSLNVP